MKLEAVKDVVEKYMNKAFRLYQDENEFEVCFSNWCNIVFQWDRDENIEKVIIFSSQGDFEGDTVEHFKYALNFIEVNSEILIRCNKLT